MRDICINQFFHVNNMTGSDIGSEILFDGGTKHGRKQKGQSFYFLYRKAVCKSC